MKQTYLNNDNGPLIIATRNHDILPDAKYMFIPFYCTDPQCDCNSSAFQMIELDHNGNETQHIIALMDYTWNETISETNPTLGPQFLDSKLAKAGLEEFKKLLTNDSNTITYIQDGYDCTRKAFKENYYEYEQINAPFRNHNKIGRNDPCVCGSGKKYKKCCLDK